MSGWASVRWLRRKGFRGLGFADFWHPEEMTESDKPGNSGADVPPPSAGSPPPYSSPAGQYPPPPPGPYPYADMSAPFGRHPVTGEPLSDKSKIAAGLLQLVGLLGVVGIGRMYIGHTGLGIAQLVIGILTCGIGAVVWGIVDAVLILTDKVRDSEGRRLRDDL